MLDYPRVAILLAGIHEDSLSARNDNRPGPFGCWVYFGHWYETRDRVREIMTGPNVNNVFKYGAALLTIREDILGAQTVGSVDDWMLRLFRSINTSRTVKTQPFPSNVQDQRPSKNVTNDANHYSGDSVDILIRSGKGDKNFQVVFPGLKTDAISILHSAYYSALNADFEYDYENLTSCTEPPMAVFLLSPPRRRSKDTDEDQLIEAAFAYIDKVKIEVERHQRSPSPPMWQALTQGQQDIVRALSRLQTPTNSSPNNARQIADHMGAGSNSEAVRKAIQPLVKQRVVESAGKGGEGYTLTKAGWICFDQSKIKSE